MKTLLLLLILAGSAAAQIVPQGLSPTGDNSTALQTAFTNCNNYVSVPPGAWPFSHPLTIDTNCMGYEGGGATLVYTGTGTAIAAGNSAHGGAPYHANRQPWHNLNLVGPGASTSTVGLQVGTSNWGVDGVNIQGFGVGVQFASYGYTDWFRNVVLLGNQTNIYCPNSLTDYGENISFDGGTASNAAVGVNNAQCEINFDNFSFDYLTTTSLYNSGVMRLHHVHVEHSPLAIQGVTGENGYSHLTAEDSDWINDGPVTSNALVSINGGYVQLSRIHIASHGGSVVVTGTAAANSTCEQITMGPGFNNLVNALEVCP